MNSTLLRDFRLIAQRWQAEHALVVDEAGAANLERIRWLGPLIIAINGFHALVSCGERTAGIRCRQLQFMWRSPSHTSATAASAT